VGALQRDPVEFVPENILGAGRFGTVLGGAAATEACYPVRWVTPPRRLCRRPSPSRGGWITSRHVLRLPDPARLLEVVPPGRGCSEVVFRG
jgi:hypothetical protein